MIYLKEGKTPLNFAYNDEIIQEGNSKYQLNQRSILTISSSQTLFHCQNR